MITPTQQLQAHHLPIAAVRAIDMEKTLRTHCGYSAGHPWYYLLGGEIHRPKQIALLVKVEDYCGYLRDEIAAIGKRSEPRRSSDLRAMKTKCIRDLFRDIARYRALAFELRELRENGHTSKQHGICDDIHTNIGLKFSHIFNDFGHLNALEKLGHHQMDLLDIF